MKKQTCCFTGHRKIPPEQYERIAQRLKAEITALIHRGVVYFEAGGALGFDTMAARAVLELKKDYPLIKLILVVGAKRIRPSMKSSKKLATGMCIRRMSTLAAVCINAIVAWWMTAAIVFVIWPSAPEVPRIRWNTPKRRG